MTLYICNSLALCVFVCMRMCLKKEIEKHFFLDFTFLSKSLIILFTEILFQHCVKASHFIKNGQINDVMLMW